MNDADDACTALIESSNRISYRRSVATFHRLERERGGQRKTRKTVVESRPECYERSVILLAVRTLGGGGGGETHWRNHLARVPPGKRDSRILTRHLAYPHDGAAHSAAFWDGDLDICISGALRRSGSTVRLIRETEDEDRKARSRRRTGSPGSH